MNNKKMAVAGAGLIVAGIGLGTIGAILILPAVVAVTTSAAKKVGERLTSEIERGSRIVGTAAGTLQRAAASAARAGVTEIRNASAGGGASGSDRT